MTKLELNFRGRRPAVPIDWPADLARREAEACGDVLDGKLPLDRILIETPPRRWWPLMLSDLLGWICIFIMGASAIVGAIAVLDLISRWGGTVAR